MKVQNRQNGLSGLPEKTGWLRAWQYNIFLQWFLSVFMLIRVTVTIGSPRKLQSKEDREMLPAPTVIG